MLHSFLLIGQSNMAGRGFVKDVPQICHEQIKMLRMGCWQMMFEPINCDLPNAGVGPASSFAACWLADNFTEEIGLIPCAAGGTSLDDWQVGGPLFDHAIAQAKLAQRSSVIDGILWHQGENDCNLDGVKNYNRKLTEIIDALRAELDMKDTPLIVGGLGEYLPNGKLFGKSFGLAPDVTRAISEFSQNTPNCYFVTASGLTPNPDGIHIDAKSQRIFGIRYYKAYSQKQHVLSPLQDEEDILTRIQNQPLTAAAIRGITSMEFSGGKISFEEFLKKMKSLG